MLAYDGSHILHTAIAYFNVVLVEKGVIFVLSRKVFGYELKEGFADISFHVAAERRVIPDYVTLAVLSWSRCLLMFVIGEACCVSAGFEGVIIGSLSFVNFVFVAGMSEILRLMELGSCLVMLGGWLDLTLIYRGWLLGFL